MDSDALGKKGERRFGELCADTGLTFNSSLDWDKAGWDFIIDFELDDSQKLSLDNRRSPLTCRIQQKTVLSSGSSVRLSLKMAERLAKDLIPTIISVFKVNEDLQFTEGYLIHMAGDRLASVLKRLRRVGRVTSSEDLKDKFIYFTPRKNEKIDFSGVALRDALKKYIGKDIHTYVDKKRGELRSLGYDEMPFETKFSLDALNQVAFGDMFLGLSKEVEVKNFEVNETRFGLTLPTSFSESAKLSVEANPSDDCTITFVGDTNDEPAFLDGKAFFTPPGFDKKMRFVFNFVDIIVTPSEHESIVSFNFHVGEKLGDVSEWVNYWRALKIIRKKTGSVSLRISKSSDPMEFSVTHFEEKAEFGNIDAYLYLSESLDKILKRAGSGVKEKLHFKDILDEYKGIDFMRKLMQSDKAKFKIKVVASLDQAKLFNNELIFAYSLKVGSLIIACYARAALEIFDEKDGVYIKLSNMTLKKLSIVDKVESFKRIIEDAKRKESIDTVVVYGYFDTAAS